MSDLPEQSRAEWTAELRELFQRARTMGVAPSRRVWLVNEWLKYRASRTPTGDDDAH